MVREISIFPCGLEISLLLHEQSLSSYGFPGYNMVLTTGLLGINTRMQFIIPHCMPCPSATLAGFFNWTSYSNRAGATSNKCRHRMMCSIPKVMYDILYQVLLGEISVPIKDRTEPVERAYYYLYTYRDCLSIGRVNNPVSGQEETRILCEDLPTGKKVIVLKLEEKRSCIDFYNRRGKGERARKIKKRIAEAFALVSESEIQCYIVVFVN